MRVRESRGRVIVLASRLEDQAEIVKVLAKDPDGFRSHPVEGEQFILGPMGEILEAEDASVVERSGRRSPDPGQLARLVHRGPSLSTTGRPAEARSARQAFARIGGTQEFTLGPLIWQGDGNRTSCGKTMAHRHGSEAARLRIGQARGFVRRCGMVILLCGTW